VHADDRKTFRSPRPKILTTTHRLIYDCPADFDDGLGIDFRTEGLDIGACLSEIRTRGARILLRRMVRGDPQAYLDFVSIRDLDYQTVDTDYGCGVIRRPTPRDIETRVGRSVSARQDDCLWREWHAIGNDFDRAFAFFEAHKVSLLRLTEPDAFLAGSARGRAAADQ
jgi:hypothetical protein